MGGNDAWEQRRWAALRRAVLEGRWISGGSHLHNLPDQCQVGTLMMTLSLWVMAQERKQGFRFCQASVFVEG